MIKKTSRNESRIARHKRIRKVYQGLKNVKDVHI